MNASAKNSATVGKVESADKSILRPDETAQLLGISKRSLSNLQKRHAIAYSKLGRIVVFRRADIEAALERFRIAAVGE
jgi:excisionase family DNA binding protein